MCTNGLDTKTETPGFRPQSFINISANTNNSITSWLELHMSGITPKVQVLQKNGIILCQKIIYHEMLHCYQPVQRHIEQDDEDLTEVGEGAELG